MEVFKCLERLALISARIIGEFSVCFSGVWIIMTKGTNELQVYEGGNIKATLRRQNFKYFVSAKTKKLFIS